MQSMPCRIAAYILLLCALGCGPRFIPPVYVPQTTPTPAALVEFQNPHDKSEMFLLVAAHSCHVSEDWMSSWLDMSGARATACETKARKQIATMTSHRAIYWNICNSHLTTRKSDPCSWSEPPGTRAHCSDIRHRAAVGCFAAAAEVSTDPGLVAMFEHCTAAGYHMDKDLRNRIKTETYIEDHGRAVHDKRGEWTFQCLREQLSDEVIAAGRPYVPPAPTAPAPVPAP